MLVFTFMIGLYLFLSRAEAASSRVIGRPQVTLPGPGNGVLTGLTYLYEEPDFLAVNKTVDAYLGVRFAQPPIGELRFADPVPYVIEGEYNATEDGAICMQTHLQTPDPIFPGLRRDVSEDCLYLSVYSPSPKVR